METIDQHLPLTPDLNRERLDTLKRMMPDLFTAKGKLNPDELRRLADTEGTGDTERYEFRWYGKAQAKRNAFTPTRTTLVYDEKRSVNPTNTENLIIEGENLEALKLLLAAYREQIKCIYIDPPYNTGKDFVYSDNYTEDKRPYWENTGVTENGVKVDTNTDSSGRFHSDWLNLMYSRLLVARDLLAPDGAIFMSIDDNEVHHLRKLADEVFGAENFVAEFIWKSRQNKDNRTKTGASIDHEYVLCFSRNPDERILKGSPRLLNQYSNPDNDPRGSWVSANMVGLRGESERPNLHYNLIDPQSGINYGKHLMGWRYDIKTMTRLITEKRVIWPTSPDGRPRRKVFIDDVDAELPGFSSIIGENVFTRNGTAAIEGLFGARFFDFPKPPDLLKQFINQVAEKQDIVLDFFGGSGSTAQAVLELNQQDGGNRKFILVQIPEFTDFNSEAYKAGYKRISDITIERCKRVVERLTAPTNVPSVNSPQTAIPFIASAEPTPETANNVPTPGFRVFKLQKSNFPRTEWAPDPDSSTDDNIASFKKYIQEKEAQLVTPFNRPDLMIEILLKRGYQLTYTTERVDIDTKNEIIRATSGEKSTLLCLDAPILPETVEYFKTNTTEKLICLERALDTTAKWNLKHYMGDNFFAF